MNKNAGKVIEYTKARRFLAEGVRSARKPLMHGLLEVDVTKAREYMRTVKERTGESPSFTAFIIACLGQAVAEHKKVHALWNGRNKLILFDDVDVLCWVERDIAGEPQVLPCIVRASNRKTFWQIHDDVRAAQTQDLAKFDVGGAKASQVLPGWLYRPYFSLAVWIGKWFPRQWKKTYGTVTISAVGTVGTGAGWGIPPSSPSVTWITVGGIGSKRIYVDGQFVTREYLSLTVSCDHNMVDAAPAARFTMRLQELIEGAYSLPVDQEATPPANADAIIAVPVMAQQARSWS